MYKDLRSIFHQDSVLAEETYVKRHSSPHARHLNIRVTGEDAFYIQTLDIQKNLVEIRKQDKLTLKLSHESPGVALSQYIRQCLIDEIVSTNEIEGAYISRQEINNVLENVHKKILIQNFLH